jgi:hypothetical protein
LERRRVLDATLERYPLHFHVAVFPSEYVAYVASLTGRPESALLASVPGYRLVYYILHNYRITIANGTRSCFLLVASLYGSPEIM